MVRRDPSGAGVETIPRGKRDLSEPSDGIDGEQRLLDQGSDGLKNAGHRRVRQRGTGSCRRLRGRPLLILTSGEVAWLSGLLEGEGYFGLIPNKVGGKTYRYARIGVTMTDRDVVARAADLMDVGVIIVRPSGASRLPQFRAHVQGQRAVALMRVLYPHLGRRRRAQIDKVLAFEAARPDPNQARREWSSKAVRVRHRDEVGRLIRGS